MSLVTSIRILYHILIFVPYMLRLVLANEQLYTKSKDIVIHFKLVKITEIHVIWYLKL